MVKKFLFMFAIVSAIFATSCSTEEFESAQSGSEAIVSFNAQLPKGLQSKTRATYGDGTTATTLSYAVYVVENGDWTLTDLVSVDETIDMSKQVSLRLVNGSTYKIVFWADAPNSIYSFDMNTIKVTADYNNIVSNNETLDAFYAVETIVVNGAASKDVELKRPFAQINIATADLDAAKNAGREVTKSGIRVKTYNTLNFKDQSVSGEGDVTFAYADFPDASQTFSVPGYDYLSMNYLLMPADKKSDNTITIIYDNAQVPERTFNNVPLQRNYRTNIYGHLITSVEDFIVEIKPGFIDSYDEEKPEFLVEYDDTKTPAQNGQALWNMIANGPDGGIYYLEPGVYYGTNGNTSRYNNKSFTLVGQEGTIIEGQVYGMVLQDDTDPNSDMVVNLKNLTIRAVGGGSALYVKYNIVVNLDNVKLESPGSTALLLDNANQYSGAFYTRADKFGTTVNAKDLTIDSGDFIEFLSNPSSPYPTAPLTFTYFNFEGNCNFTSAQCRPQSPSLVSGVNFVNGVAVNNPNATTAMVTSAAEITSAIANATGNITVVFGNDITGNSIAVQKAGVNVVIDGQGHKYDGTIFVHGNARSTGPETLDIKNINFETATPGLDFISANSTAATERYAHNVTVSDCTFKGNGIDNVGMRYRQCFNMKVEDCIARNMHSLMWATGGENINVESVDIASCLNGVSFATANNITVKSSIITGTTPYGYAIRVDADNAYSLTVQDCVLTADVPVLLRKATADYTLTFAGTNTLNSTRDYQIIACANDYAAGTALLPTIGNVTISGAGLMTIYR